MLYCEILFVTFYYGETVKENPRMALKLYMVLRSFILLSEGGCDPTFGVYITCKFHVI